MTNPWLKFDKKWKLSPMPSANMPVFALASVWRSGSTLLQRLICSSPEILLWGEPYGDAALIPNIVKSAKVLLRNEWPGLGHFPEYWNDEHAKSLYVHPERFWIANLYPLPQDMRNSFRASLDTWLQQSVQRYRRERFGLKEVRLDGECAHFLEWIYPDARFVFLMRNPWDAWRSYKGARWYFHWPDICVTKVEVFATIWKHNLKSFLAFQGQENSLFVRFEEIAQESTIQRLQDHCKLQHIQREVLEQKIRGMNKPPTDISTAEIQKIYQICGPLAAQMGYKGPQQTIEPLLGDLFQ